MPSKIVVVALRRVLRYSVNDMAAYTNGFKRSACIPRFELR